LSFGAVANAFSFFLLGFLQYPLYPSPLIFEFWYLLLASLPDTCASFAVRMNKDCFVNNGTEVFFGLYFDKYFAGMLKHHCLYVGL